jgi:hypothetical protein
VVVPKVGADDDFSPSCAVAYERRGEREVDARHGRDIDCLKADTADRKAVMGTIEVGV